MTVNFSLTRRNISWMEVMKGSTTVSETLGDGKTEKVSIILLRYASWILEMRRVPMPEPVPPTREWQTWKPADLF
nr:unnamed protein product [Digitaria exilis]